MLEGLIVYTITVFLLFLILAIFSLLYQSWNIQTIANETAAKAAQTYKLSETSMTTGYATREQVAGVSRFRYWFGDDSLEREAAERITYYAQTRLTNTTYTRATAEPQIEVEVKKDALARQHIEVTITGEYTVPFGEALSYFGFDSIAHYETTAYAECLDLIEYANTVDFVSEQTKLNIFGSKFIGMVNKILKLIKDTEQL